MPVRAPCSEHAEQMQHLRHDPVGSLLAADDSALRHVARRELLGETTPKISTEELPGVRRAVARRQRASAGHALIVRGMRGLPKCRGEWDAA